MMLCWEALNFKLAYRKGQLGPKVDWIGGNLQFTATGISARVKDTIVQDILRDLDAFEGLNVIPVKDLRSFVGRANHAAGLLLVLRPFLHSIWGALYGESGGAPANTVWAKQIRHALEWLSAFFRKEVHGVTRHFSLEEFSGTGPLWEIGTDASPWGLGGWLSCDGKITKYYTSPVSEEDLGVFGLIRGSCESQQTLEGLAILVALRLWNDSSHSRFIRLCVRGDSVGALTLLIKMRPSSAQQAIIARELALVTAKAAFPPTVNHTLGVAHKLADMLSRVYDPGRRAEDALRHPSLEHAVRTPAPGRPRSWYRTLALPVRSA